jgi:predicted transcriptional regulator
MIKAGVKSAKEGRVVDVAEIQESGEWGSAARREVRR